MSNPQISFRLSPYHIARGLKILKNLDHSYAFTSINQIIRDCFLDYLAKMSANTSDQILPEDFDKIKSILTIKRIPLTNLDDFLNQLTPTTIPEPPSQESALNKLFTPSKEQPTPNQLSEDSPTDSNISSVSDFTPPTNWLDDTNDDNQ